MPEEIMKIISAGLFIIAGAVVFNAIDCILRWKLDQVILGGIALTLAYFLVVYGWRGLGG